MNDCVTSCVQWCFEPLRNVLCGALIRKVDNLFSLSNNIILLGWKTNQLKEWRDGVMAKIKIEESDEPPRKRTIHVVEWLKRVEDLSKEASIVQAAYENRMICCCGCPRNCWSSYRLGGRVAQLLVKVDFELSKKDEVYDHLIENLTPPRKYIWLLRKKMEELEFMQGVVSKKVKLRENQGLARTDQTDKWLKKVQSLYMENSSIESEFQHSNECVDGCYLGCLPSDELGRRAAELLDEVEGAITERSRLHNLVEAIPTSPFEGTDSVLEAALAKLSDLCFNREDAHVIGVCGMGGVGKTALLTRFKDVLLHRPHDFDKIIYVVVSKEPNIEKMQRQICKWLNLKIEPGDNIDKLATMISEALGYIKFFLLLDDVWDGSEFQKSLDRMGVPHRNKSKCKLVLTTRSKEVCIDMGAGEHIVSVNCLESEEAWVLFMKNVGETKINSDPKIETLARDICKKCGGLPLALTVTGKAMASKTTVEEWNHAASALKKLRIKNIKGFENDLLYNLELSYDSLPDDTTKECFLYCCLYPEDHNIDKEELVEYWVGEGFFDKEYRDDIVGARGEGHTIIGLLTATHLLERSLESDTDVRMHDVIRDMALWISRKGENKFLVHAGIGLIEAPAPEDWGGNRRISLMHNRMKTLPGAIPECPNLSTLLLQRNTFSEISGGLFQSTPNLRVLDMAGHYESHITRLPEGIGLLTELQHLNLSWTRISSLPVELGRLTKLRQLYLDHTSDLDSIPREAISGLSKLQVFSLWKTNYSIGDGSTNVENSIGGVEVSLQDLEALKSLQDLRLQLKSAQSCQRFLSSTHLPRTTYALLLNRCNDLGTINLSSTNSKMDRLRKLEIFDCSGLEEIIISGEGKGPLLPELESLTLFELRDLKTIKVGAQDALKNLHRLRISGCENLKHVRWVRQLNCLRDIGIHSCKRMEHLIDGDEGAVDDQASTRDLQWLKFIDLRNMPALKTICEHPLVLPSLERICVEWCPELKKLPLAIDSVPNLTVIRGPQEWWDGLEWEDESVKSTFVKFYEMMVWSHPSSLFLNK